MIQGFFYSNKYCIADQYQDFYSCAMEMVIERTWIKPGFTNNNKNNAETWVTKWADSV